MFPIVKFHAYAQTQTSIHKIRNLKKEIKNCDMKYNKCRCDPIASNISPNKDMTFAQNVYISQYHWLHVVCALCIHEQYEQSVDSLNRLQLWKNTTRT